MPFSFQLRHSGRALLAVAWLAVPLTPAAAQSAADSELRSSERARTLLDQSLAAHGGEARLRGLKDLSIRMRGRRWMAYQSPTLARPWTTQPTETDIVLDFAKGRLFRHSVSRYPVDFAFEGTNVVTAQGGFFYDPSRAGYGDAVLRFPGSSVASHPARRELPALQLLIARDRPETLRWAGESSEDGLALQGVSYAEPNGAVYTLWLDAATRRLVRLDWLRDDPVEGDQLASYVYSGYRTEQGIPVPSRLIERRNGEVLRDDVLTIAIDRGVADSLFAAPGSGFTELADARPTGPEAEAVRKLADNVWLLQQIPGGNRVLFVAFRDHVLVFEAPAPQSAATAVLDAVRRTVPNKPVRYVTFSHHHDDHGGGLRPYIAEGVTIVTTPKNRALVMQVAKARHAMRPDALSTSAREPVVETFTSKRVFTDGVMTVELHDIGPTSHVDEMVLAYLPNERLVFQGDLLILPERGTVGPANQLTAEFARAIDRLRLDVRTIAGVHGRVGTIEDLRQAVALRERSK
jgi:glyoxylase-like metal-dependent hydrolase (beta-lactamase superfamily II)